MKSPKSLLLVCILFLTHIASAKEPVRIAIGEWQPYLSSHAPHYGFAAHIVTESFALQGIEVEYGFFPWKRSFMLSQKGDLWDGTAVWLHSEDRANSFYYSDPVVQTTTSFFHLKDIEFDWTSIKDLSGMKIGVTLGYSYGADFDSAIKNKLLDADPSRNDELNLQKIQKRRIDIFPGEVMVMYSLIRELFPPDVAEHFTHHPKALLNTPQHLLLSKANPDNEQLMKIFNTGLKQLKESGRYEKIIANGLSGKYASQK